MPNTNKPKITIITPFIVHNKDLAKVLTHRMNSYIDFLDVLEGQVEWIIVANGNSIKLDLNIEKDDDIITSLIAEVPSVTCYATLINAALVRAKADIIVIKQLEYNLLLEGLVEIMDHPIPENAYGIFSHKTEEGLRVTDLGCITFQRKVGRMFDTRMDGTSTYMEHFLRYHELHRLDYYRMIHRSDEVYSDVQSLELPSGDDVSEFIMQKHDGLRIPNFKYT